MNAFSSSYSSSVDLDRFIRILKLLNQIFDYYTILHCTSLKFPFRRFSENLIHFPWYMNFRLIYIIFIHILFKWRLLATSSLHFRITGGFGLWKLHIPVISSLFLTLKFPFYGLVFCNIIRICKNPKNLVQKKSMQ